MNQLRVLPSGLSAVGVPDVFAPRSSVIAALGGLDVGVQQRQVTAALLALVDRTSRSSI